MEPTLFSLLSIYIDLIILPHQYWLNNDTLLAVYTHYTCHLLLVLNRHLPVLLLSITFAQVKALQQATSSFIFSHYLDVSSSLHFFVFVHFNNIYIYIFMIPSSSKHRGHILFSNPLLVPHSFHIPAFSQLFHFSQSLYRHQDNIPSPTSVSIHTTVQQRILLINTHK